MLQQYFHRRCIRKGVLGIVDAEIGLVKVYDHGGPAAIVLAEDVRSVDDYTAVRSEPPVKSKANKTHHMALALPSQPWSGPGRWPSRCWSSLEPAAEIRDAGARPAMAAW